MSSRRTIASGGWLLMSLWLASCWGPPADEKIRSLPATRITIAQADAPGVHPQAFTNLRRPAVEFDHGLHLEAVEKTGAQDACAECHPSNQAGAVVPLFGRKQDPADRTALTDLYHARCLECHKEREAAGEPAGPVVCGGCHSVRGPSVSTRRSVAFDYSLHHRHERNYRDDCGACHHQLDEATGKLVYIKGTESACRDCHLDYDQDKNYSLRGASHRACIQCHRGRAAQNAKTGPWTCAGCHDPKAQDGIERIDDPPRLMRKQPDLTWIRIPEARAKLVLFDHKLHEPLTKNCSTCHHKTLKACKDCHRIRPVDEGGGITLERAYHLASSERSCTGCHRIETQKKACRGCHDSIALPAEGSCQVCHSGPAPTPALDVLPEPEARSVVLSDLPTGGWDFPDQIIIDVVKKKYQAADFPHRKIVESLGRPVAASKLASAFHARTETLCAGCHHHSPFGDRPAPCRSCHDDRGDATRDQPDLISAYHRQCLGCHREMNLKLQGCEDCHREAVKEVSP